MVVPRIEIGEKECPEVKLRHIDVQKPLNS